MANATCELVWLKQLLQELKFCEVSLRKLVCDNQATLHFAYNPVFHERIKHIEINCHFIREKLDECVIVIEFVNCNNQLANVFTKSLKGSRVEYICNKFGAYDIYAPV